VHPALTYSLLALCVGLFAAAFWVDGRPDVSRFAPLRRFTLIAQICAIGGAYAVLRPGRGGDGTHALGASMAAGRPVLLDMYSNW
jgi:hypothetical protein